MKEKPSVKQDRVSVIIEEIKHGWGELHRILPLKAVLRLLSYPCQMFHPEPPLCNNEGFKQE